MEEEMKLEEIISAAVEKKVFELVNAAVTRTRWDKNLYDDRTEQPSPVEQQIAMMVSKIAQEELAKHEDRIRQSISNVIMTFPSIFEIRASATLKTLDK